jgi:hypothetical protein
MAIISGVAAASETVARHQYGESDGSGENGSISA